MGSRRVMIDGVQQSVSLFVTTLGYSRRLHVRAFPGEKQEHWFASMESAFAAFGGVPEEVLLDKPQGLQPERRASSCCRHGVRPCGWTDRVGWN